MNAKVFTIAHLPAELRTIWLQHVRDFDVAHPGCHFETGIEAPGESLVDMVEMLKVDPELTFTKIFERKQTTMFRKGDAIDVTFGGRVVDGEIVLVSENQVSVVINFEAIIGVHAGSMPVLLTEQGTYRSVIDGSEVTITLKLSKP